MSWWQWRLAGSLLAVARLTRVLDALHRAALDAPLVALPFQRIVHDDRL
jgi:hypothetical protein